MSRKEHDSENGEKKKKGKQTSRVEGEQQPDIISGFKPEAAKAAAITASLLLRLALEEERILGE